MRHAQRSRALRAKTAPGLATTLLGILLQPYASGAATTPLRVATGQYSGLGLVQQSVTGVGFRPDVVVVKSNGNGPAIICSSTMPAGQSKQLALASAFVTNRVTSLDTDGFTVGTTSDVNSLATMYYWVAITGASSDLALGSYLGNGVDNRAITVGFAPAYVVVWGAGAQAGVHRFAGQGGDTTLLFGGGATLTNQIQALQATGFEIGTGANVNTNGQTYHYLALKSSFQGVTVGSYTGNGIDNRNIAGTGFQPDYLIVRGEASVAAAHRPASLTGASALAFDATASFTNAIQLLQPDGFQVGTDTRVNTNAVTYRYLGLRTRAAVDLGTTLWVDDAAPLQSAPVKLSARVTNSGPNPASGIQVTIALPTGLTFSASAATHGTFDAPSGTWTLSSLAAAAADTLTVTATVDIGTQGTTLVTPASVAHVDQFELDPSNDSGSVSVTVNEFIRDAASTLLPVSIFVGDTAPFLIRVNNLKAQSVALDTGTTLSFSDGTVSFVAALANASTIPANATGFALSFVAAQVPPTMVPLVNRDLTLHLHGVRQGGGAYTETISTAGRNAVFVDRRAVTIAASPLGNATAHPGDRRVPLLALTMASELNAPSALDSLVIAGAVLGPGTVAQRNAEVEALELFDDIDGNGTWSIADTPLGLATMPNGKARFDVGGTWTIPANGSRQLVVCARVDSLRARDGDILDLVLASSGHVVFTAPTPIESTFTPSNPLNSDGVAVVDGMLAHQVRMVPAGVDTLVSGAMQVPLTGVVLPANGYAADVLTSLSIQDTAGDFTPADFSAVSLYADDGDRDFEPAVDALLGTMAFAGDRYVLSGLSFPINGNKMLFLVANIAVGATDGHHFRPAIPLNGAQMQSGNDGPTDVDVESPTSLFLAFRPRIDVSTLAPGIATAGPGQVGVPLLRLRLRNQTLSPVGLTSLRLANASTGPGTTNQLDTETGSLTLYADDGNGVVNSWDPVLAGNVVFNAGSVLVPGLNATISSGAVLDVLVASHVDSTCARDGDVLRCSVASPSSIGITGGAPMAGTFPAHSLSAVAVDGMVAHQMDVITGPGGPLLTTKNDVELLGFTLPGNGYAPDSLSALTVFNAGTADDTHIDHLWLYADDGDELYNGAGNADIRLGEFSYLGGRRFQLQGLAYLLPSCASRQAFFVVADLHAQVPGGASVQFGVPAHGVVVRSSNDGPRDADVVTPQVRLIPQPDQVTVFDASVGNHDVHPGSRDHLGLSLAFYNGYTTPVSVHGLRAFQTGSALVSEIDSVRIHIDGDGDDRFDASHDPAIAAIATSDIYAAFAGLAVDIPAHGATRLFLCYDVSLVCRDGVSVDFQLNAANDISLAPVSQGAGIFPVNSQGIDLVDGMVSAQIGRIAAPPRNVPASENDVWGLGLRIPANGTAADRLDRVAVTNSGSAVAGQDIASVRLWAEGGGNPSSYNAGQETYVADLQWTGSEWSNAGLLNRPIPAGGAIYYATFSTAASMQDGRTVQLALPINGITVGSSNDGPIDAEIVNAFAQTTTNDALIATLASDRREYSVGQTITLAMSLRNAGSVALSNVTPSTPILTGPGSVQWVSGPFPPTVDLAPAETRVIVWSLVANGPGTLVACAAAATADSATVAGTSCALSFEIQTAPTAISASLTDQTIPAVNEGANGVQLLRAVLSRADGPAAADAVVDGIDIRILDQNGAPISANQVFSTLHAQQASSGVTSVSVVDSLHSLVRIRLATPVVLAPTGNVSLNVFADVAPASAGRGLRVEIAAPSAIHVLDANTANAVAVGSGQSFPWRTGSMQVWANAESLLVSSPGPVVELVNAAQDNIALGSLVAGHPGPSQVAPVAIRGLTLTFTDSLGAVISPGSAVRHLTIGSGATTLFETGLSPAAAAPLVIALTTPLVVAAGASPSITLSADVRGVPDVARFVVRLDGTSSVAAVDLNDGDSIAIRGTWPLVLADVSIQQPASGVAICYRSRVPAVLLPSQTDAGLIDISFRHPDASASSIRVESVKVTFRHTTGVPLFPGSYFDGVDVYRGNVRIAQNTALSTTNDFVDLALQPPLVLSPAQMDSISIRVNTKPAFAPASFRAHVDRDHLVVTDLNTGATLAGVTGTFPLVTDACQLLTPSQGLQIAMTNDVAGNVVGTERGVRIATLSLQNAGDAGATSLDLRSLRLVIKTRGGSVIDATRLISRASLFEGDSLLVNATVDATGLAFNLASGRCRINGSGSRTLRLEADLGASISGSFRFHLAAASDVSVIDAVSGSATNATGPFPFQSGVLTVLGASPEKTFTNYPNPFAAGRESTRITFFTDAPSRVTLHVFTLWGAPVRTLLANDTRAAGLHQDVTWDGRNGDGDVVANGVYYLVLDYAGDAGARTVRRKIAVLR